MVGVEAGGLGLASGRHGASLARGKVGTLHGTKSYVMINNDGQVQETHSISAGLDYPGVGPEHSFYKDTGRARYVSATDKQALSAFEKLSKLEGILPALESSHAVAHAIKLAAKMKRSEFIVVCLSGRGDKDVSVAQQALQP